MSYDMRTSGKLFSLVGFQPNLGFYPTLAFNPFGPPAQIAGQTGWIVPGWLKATPLHG